MLGKRRDETIVTVYTFSSTSLTPTIQTHDESVDYGDDVGMYIRTSNASFSANTDGGATTGIFGSRDSVGLERMFIKAI